MSDKKQFLTVDFPKMVESLDPNTVANFGLMTPQHMVEHLTSIIKVSIKRQGEPENPMTPKQLGFQRFVKNGAIMQHRPSQKTAADLPALRYDSYESAAAQIKVATDRFYAHFEANPDAISYLIFTGEIGFEDLELLHYMHCRYHAWQFGLIETYPEV